MIHPQTEVRYINPRKGYGLFAAALIPCGTITWTRDPLDREFTKLELLAYPPLIQDIILQYSYRNSQGNFIFCWDNTRYMNHSDAPNSCLTPYELELAVCDISPGEEITNHYGTLNIIEPFTPDEETSITVNPDDLLHHSSEWDTLLGTVFPRLIRVEQPLKNFIEPERWRQLQEISAGNRPMDSIRSCLYRA